MAVVATYPGVYTQEIPSGVRTIVGVSTSIGMFIGRAAQGELFRPVRCLSYPDFDRAFSTEYANSDLAREVKLFFDNGGAECFVTRIANGALSASVMVQDEAGVNTLLLTALSAGPFGNDIRASVNYNTASPEATFNLELFRWVKGTTGAQQKAQIESYVGLSMDKDHPRYVEDIVNLNSKLVRVTDPRKAVALAGNGLSVSGYAISARTTAIFVAAINAVITPAQCRFRIGVGGRPPAAVDLGALLPLAGNPAAVQGILQAAINAALPPGVTVTVVFQPGPVGPALQPNTNTVLLTIQGNGGTDVYIDSSSTLDLAGPLMLGTAQGGIEIPRASTRRPAPNGVVFRSDFAAFPNDYTNFGEQQQVGAPLMNAVRVAGVAIDLSAPALRLQTTLAPPVVDPRLYQDATATNQNDGRNGVREKFSRIAAGINAAHALNPNFRWTAEVWGSRLAVIGVGDVPDTATTTLEAGNLAGFVFTPIANVFETVGQPMTRNVRYYPLAATAPGPFHLLGVIGTPGIKPTPAEYQAAYTVIDREVDIFNLMVLPRDADMTILESRALIGPASTFCEARRAFLLIDPPGDWIDHNSTVDAAIGVNTLRVGLAKQFSAVYFPNLMIREGDKEIPVGPGGAVAGVMARIDATRGVWKSAAGVEADLRGIVGVQRRLSDAENGVMNPHAVNAIRVFPNGIVVWGARTMDGDDAFGSEYKYSSIRRLANYMLESMYRGLKWAVFEPNDETLWAQIRLNVGAFMHGLFRQGAFEGLTARDSYFVRCDSTTTTALDQQLGYVNVVVGFAPVKPGEFIVLYLQQIAGQIQT